MKFHRLTLFLVTAVMTALLVACGALGSKPPIWVAFTAGLTPPTSMDASANINVAATVINDPAHAGVNWTVNCGSDPCGTFDTANPAASSSPVTYHAPDSAPSENTVTLTATSVSDNTKSVSAIVTITANPK
jgi:hypothetical protein